MRSTEERSSARARRFPFVLLNLAMTADGKISTSDRKLSSFGSKRDREHLLELRATADAVMSGARTVGSGPVTLGPGGLRFRRLRLSRGLSEYNLRIIVSRTGSIDPRAQVFRTRFSPVVVLTTEMISAKRLRLLSDVCEVRICGKHDVNWEETLRWLRAEKGVRRLLCEGGGELNDSLFRAGVVNEVHLTVCPFIFGGRDAPTISEGAGFPSLAQAAQLRLKKKREHNDESFLIYTVISGQSVPKATAGQLDGSSKQ